MKRLLARRVKMPWTATALAVRSRHSSSRREASSRAWRPLSMPQAARLQWSQSTAWSRSGGRLVTSATVSGFWPSTSRRSRAAWAASGKLACSGVMGALCNVRVSFRLLLRSRLPARVSLWARTSRAVVALAVGAGGSGKKGDRRLRHEAFDVVADRRLVAFDGEDVVGAVFEHQRAGRFVLGVEGIEADDAPVEIELGEELARHGDFVGLLIHHGAAQIMLA